MNQIEFLMNKGILVTELKNKGDQLRKKWEQEFAKHLSKSQKSKIYFNQHLWHVFSYNKLSCLEGQEAMKAFNTLKKNECYIFYQDDKNALFLENAKSVKAKDIIINIGNYIDDAYVVDKDFKWTFIHTHEYFCGPYFFEQ